MYVKRIKVYNKFLALLQSSGVMKGMGMNTGQIYQPTYRKHSQLLETENQGWTRIEISYYAHSVEEEKRFWSRDFIDDAEQDIALTHIALNETKGVRYHIPMYSIL